MRIRKFRKEDARKVSYLVIKAHKEVLSKSYSKKIIDFFCRRDSPSGMIKKSRKRDLFIAVEGNRIFGINGLQGNEVRTFYVNPIYHRKGIGRKLIEHVEKLARKKGIKKLVVRSSLYAEGFYKKCGFRRIKKILSNLNNMKFHEILMEKNLK